MILNKIILPLVAGTLLLSGCYDEKMEWGTPDDHGPVTTGDIPLALQEEIDQYQNIKTYMQQYMPGVPIGLGITEGMYEEGGAYRDTALANFTMFTPGNIMKQGNVVQNDGTLNFTAIDAFMEQATADGMPVFGHNFVWSTQQNSTYLTGLIAPKVTSTGGEDAIANMLSGDNTDFEGGTMGSWGSWGNSSTSAIVQPGYDSNNCVQLINPTDGSDYYVAQFGYTFGTPLVQGTTYTMRFKAKCSIAGGSVQFCAQNGSTYSDGEPYTVVNVGTDWVTCEIEYNCTKTANNQILINFGKVAGTYDIDDIEFGIKVSAGAKGARLAKSDPKKASGVTYTFKTPEEKTAALTEAMQTWITGMATHCPTIKEWDVVNEPILDGSNKLRGVGAGSFNDGDSSPVEDPETGLTMNWATGTFYWGYYLGKNYGVQAFKIARQAVGVNAKLYINEYNLETSPEKLKALIDYVNYIEDNGGQVDGIGTQMHVTAGQLTQDQVDAMFKTLAATGKLIRISELDVKLGTAAPTADQLIQQGDVYNMIITSYRTNVPAAQQGGVCVWCLTDAADEHTYWIPNDTPDLFDGNFVRKPAYKGICDGIAGQDLGAGFTGDSWKDLYK